MKHLLLLLLSFLFSVCYGDQISTEKFSVEKFISPLKGRLVFQGPDLIANGKEKIKLIRHYNSQVNTSDENQGDQSWNFFAHTTLDVQKKTDGLHFFIPKDNGDILAYCKSPSENRYTLVIDAPYSNFNGDIPSGRHDDRNGTLFIKNGGSHVVYVSPCGIKRIYKTDSNVKNQDFFTLYLEKEFLLNGNTIQYEYDSHQNLIEVKSFDPTGNHLYSSISLNYLNNHIIFKSSSNTQATYYYQSKETRQKKSNLEKVTIKSHPLLTAITSPYCNKEQLDYTKDFTLHAIAGNKNPFQVIYSENGENQRVKSLLTQDSNFTYSPKCYLEYEPAIFGRKVGKTTVTHHDGTKTIYHYNKDLLLVQVDQISQENAYLNSKTLTWNEKNYLESIKLTQGSGNLLFELLYEYDQFGNPTKESYYRNFNGGCQVTKREFSQDGRHLLLKIEKDNGYSEEYTYLKNTNLITSKYIKFFDEIVQRNFFEYDESHNCIIEILDDGSTNSINDMTSVTTRRKSLYKYKKNDPFKHMVVEAEHLVLDGIEFKHAFSKQFFYDKYGNVTKENTIDKNYNLAYSLHKKYDASGNLISETNPIGEISEAPIKKEVSKEELLQTINFDSKNTQDIGGISSFLMTPTESARNNRAITIQNQSSVEAGNLEKVIYNPDGTPNRKIRRDGLETYFEYDPMGRITLEEKRFDGDLVDQKTYVFSAFYLLSETHNGIETIYTYTPFGKLESQTTLGKTIYFSYDTLNRLSGAKISDNGLDRCVNIKQNLLNERIEKNLFSQEGEHISNTFTYDNTGKIAAICFKKGLEVVNLKYESENPDTWKQFDANGIITTHSHEFDDESKCLKIFKIDGKNTKTIKTLDTSNNRTSIEILSSDNVTLQKKKLFYDNQQNLTKKENYYFQNGICTKVQSFTYEYDLNRNCVAFYREKGTMQERMYTFSYDTCNRVTSRTYPNGITLLFSYTPLGNLATLKSSDNTIYYEYRYDMHGNLIEAIDHHTQKSVFFERDIFGNIALQTDVNNFTIQKEYDGFSRPTKLILPDGSWIKNTYDNFHLTSVTRYSSQLVKKYTHFLSDFNLYGISKEHRMGYDLDTKHLHFDAKNNLTSSICTYFKEENSFDSLSNRIASKENNITRTFRYDAFSEVQEEVSKDGRHFYAINERNFNNTQINSLGELLSHDGTKYHYDLNGNLVSKQTLACNYQYSYDALNRLIQVRTDDKELHFSYDPLGRRSTQTLFTKSWFTTKSEKECYVYDGNNELGSFTQDRKPIAIKVQASEKENYYPIGIELKDKNYIPIIDTDKNVRLLIDPETKKVACHYTYSAFGNLIDIDETIFNPYRYKSCRWNELTGSFQIHGRDYLPDTNRYLTPCDKDIIFGEKPYHLN